MLESRVIPCLLLDGRRLVKTRRFREPKYVGDPINAVKIFNEKEVDEVVLLDIGAWQTGRPPDYELLQDVAGEAFMPLCYGGGVRSLDAMHRLFRIGFEKVALNSVVAENPELIGAAAREFGNQSVVVSLDVKRSLLGRYEVRVRGGTRGTGVVPEVWARQAESRGAGELLVTAIDRDGMMNGGDLELVERVTRAVGIPVVACGGVGTLDHLVELVCDAGASGAGAGSFFVFHGRHRAVLISYPDAATLHAAFARRVASR